ncbi:MAG: hypothetical protein J6B09_04115 [Clostridia bacterium]|nr:hypothetical protein [Clostridia bacterium]
MTATKKKIVATCVVMILTVLTFVCSTLAYFTDNSNSRYNTIATGTTSVELLDVTYPYGSDVAVAPGTAIRIFPGYEIKKTVTARNTGDMPMYVRVKLTPEITLANNARGRETEIDTSLVSYNIDEANWTLHTDGYYYYNAALTEGQEAPPLMTKVKFSESMGNLYKDSTIKFTVFIQVVQSSNNGSSAIEAQNWSAPRSKGGVS